MFIKIKKVIFKDMTGLSINEKLSIVGSLIGKSKKITAEDIYEYMVTAADHNQKITIPKIANHFQNIKLPFRLIKKRLTLMSN